MMVLLKIIKLHEKYGIPGMFFVPNRNSEGRAVLTPQDIQTARSDLIFFGGHTKDHVYLTNIKPDLVENEIVDNKKYLEDILGEEITHFCLPGGKYNRDILEKAFKHFRTVRTADTMNFRNKELLIKPTIHFYPRTYKSRVGNCTRNHALKEGAILLLHPHWNLNQMCKSLIEMDRSDNKTIIIWGHSWEIDELYLWADLEMLFMYISREHKNLCVDYFDICK